MKTITLVLTFFMLLAIGMMIGCTNTTKSPDVADSIRKSLDQSGLKDVSVSQDRDKGVVTLTGNVPADSDKSKAESIAKSIAEGRCRPDCRPSPRWRKRRKVGEFGSG